MDEDARLTGLLSVKRSPLKAGLVEAVMAQAVSTLDKIQRIEMIDLLPDAPPPPKRRPSAPLIRNKPEPPVRAAQSAPPPLVDPNLDEPDRVEHQRRHLGRPPSRGGWWRYFFLERQRMAEWGARTGTLIRGLIPFTLKLSPEAMLFGVQELRNEILPVLDNHLPRFLKQAWKTLEKFDYNLLAAVNSLCGAIAAVHIVRGPKGLVPSSWDAVLPAMVLFWTAEGLPERAITAWHTVCAQLGADDVRLSGQDSLRALLRERTDRVSLPDFLRALLMLRTRRAVPWSELLPREDGDYFARDAFDCPPEVQAEIDRAVTLLRQQLDQIGRDYTETRRIRYFLPAGSLLEEFDRGQSRENLGAWTRQFLERAEVFVLLLTGTVELRGGERVLLFRDIALTSAVKRLDTLRSQRGEDSEELPSAVARVVTNVGKLVVQQIRTRSLAADPLVRAADPAQNADPLPFETIELEAPGWEGVKVIDAVVLTARICLLAGRLLGDTSLEAALEREEPLRARARDLLGKLVRLARPDEIAGVRAAWAAALDDAPAVV
jgi:hypothetical protein